MTDVKLPSQIDMYNTYIRMYYIATESDLFITKPCLMWYVENSQTEGAGWNVVLLCTFLPHSEGYVYVQC